MVAALLDNRRTQSAMSDKGLRLKPPSPLPRGPVSKIAFKVFLNQLRAYVEQDCSNYMFLPEGCYATWHPKQEGRRIQELSEDDVENQKLIQQAAAREPRIDLPAEQARLLLSRNSQVGKFITLIAILCHYTEQDDIDNCSTSWEWITQYLRQHYNIENRGEHFLDITEVSYTSEMSYQSFYKQFRAGFLDNLRKRGDRLLFKNNQLLTADESMSPTLEAAIVLWALERIDPRLPRKVKKNYGHQMVGDNCIVSLQPTIFQNIQNMLDELDSADNTVAAAQSLTQLECNQIYARRRGNVSNRVKQTGNRRTSNNTNRKVVPKKFFCRICYHAGASQAAYTSHPISTCKFLTQADKADLRGMTLESLSLTEEPKPRHQPYHAPGWDEQEQDSESHDSDNDYDEINNDSYDDYSNNPYRRYQANGLTLQLNVIKPVPSQVLITKYMGSILPITLDSGATISFIRADWAKQLNLPISPNKQVATLADELTSISAIGEIDITVTYEQYSLRLQALVVPSLQAPCFGGTNFHRDNKIVPNIADQTVQIGMGSRNQTDTWDSMITVHEPKENNTKTVQLKSAATVLPGGDIHIPLQGASFKEKVIINPSFQGVDPSKWPVQICHVIDNEAIYVNKSPTIITSPKYAHFAAVPVRPQPMTSQFKAPNSSLDLQAPQSVDKMLQVMKINKSKMTNSQQAHLEAIHRKYCQVFDSDMSGGYNHRMGKYELSFVFKDTSTPPPLKVWAPQYNRSCQDLLQAKCDQLEQQGVLIDPMEANIDILHLSPIMIQQKGRAKFKKLHECSLE